MRGCGFILLFVSALARAAIGQEPGVELLLNSRTLEIGEAIDAQLVCTNTGPPESPTADVSDGLELTLLQPTPAQSSMISIVNGRRSEKTTYTYYLRLTALKEGSYVLGPVSVAAGGATYVTEPVNIVVKKTDPEAGQKGDRLVYLEMEVEPRSLYVTESYVATLRLGMRKVLDRGRVVDMNLLAKVLDQRASQFSIFAREQVRKNDTYLRDSAGVRHSYRVFTITKRVRADEAGQARVGPVFVRINYPTALRRGWGFFDSYQVLRSQKATARAEAITVDVKAPPEEDRPADFTGAIGRFNMKVGVKPTTVEKGQPVTLTATITGGPLAGVAGPDLAAQPELASRFDYTKDELVGDIEGNAKVFRRAIFPKQEGEQTIPPISWSYFDTRREQYVTVTSDPIDIVVHPPSTTSAPIRLAETSTSEHPGSQLPNGESLTVVVGGISPNYVDVDSLLADQRFTLSLPWMAALVAGPLVCLAVTLTSKRRARLRDDVRYARRRFAQRNAERLLKKALRASEPGEQLDAVGQALIRYIADRFGLPTGHLTPGEVRQALSDHRTDQATADEIAVFLESCEAARYASASVETTPPKEAVTMVRLWMKRL